MYEYERGNVAKIVFRQIVTNDLREETLGNQTKVGHTYLGAGLE